MQIQKDDENILSDVKRKIHECLMKNWMQMEIHFEDKCTQLASDIGVELMHRW